MSRRSGRREAGRKSAAGIAALFLILAFGGRSGHAQQATQTNAPSHSEFALNEVELAAQVIRTDNLSGVPGLTVTFFFNGSSQTAVTDANGDATTTYAMISASGSYVYGAAWLGDGSFAASYSTRPVTINKRPTNMVPFGSAGFALENVEPTARLIDGLTGLGVQGKSVDLWFNGSTQTATTDSQGDATKSFSAPATASTMPFTATFIADAIYAGNNTAGTVTVQRRPTTLFPDNVDVSINADFEVQARLKDTRSGGNLEGKTIDFEFAGTEKSALTNSVGIATVTYTAPAATGTYTYTVDFSSDATYEAFSETGTVIVDLINTLVVPVDVAVISSANFLARAQLINTDSSLGIQGKTLKFTFNGSTLTNVTDSFGIAGVTFKADILPSTAPFVAAFTGDTEFKAGTGTGTVTINQRPVDVTAIDASGITPSTLFIASATLADQTTGGPISSHTLSFLFQGTTVYGTTNDVGLATAAFTAPAEIGLFNFYVRFSSTILYSQDNDTGTANVQKINTLLSADDVVVPADTLFTATATLTEAGSGDPIAGKTVTFTFQGHVQTGVTDAFGQATTTYIAPSILQTYPLSVSFAGDITYFSDNDAAIVNVIKREVMLTPDEVTVRIDETFIATATLVDGFDGSPVDGESIEFVYAGSTLTAVTGEFGVPGVATVTFSAPSSSATLEYTVEFFVNGLYEGKKETGTVNVILPPTELAVDEVNVFALGVIYATATLTVVDTGAPLSGRTVRLIFAGSTVTRTSNGSGVSSTTFAAPTTTGTYTLWAEWDGETDVYGATIGSAAVNVLERPAVLGVSSETVTVSALFTASATFTDDQSNPVLGATVYFLLDGSTQTALTDALGLAATDFYAPASSGTYELQGTFESSGTYAGRVSSAALTVLPRAMTLSADAAAAVVNEVFTASATLTVGGSPLEGVTIRFVFNGASHTAVTDALGEATTDYASPASSGTFVLETFFDETPVYGFAQDTADITVAPRATALDAEPGAVVINELFTATATLTDFAGPVAGLTVRFVFAGATQTAVTDALGVATTDYATPASTGTFNLEAYFDADAVYAGAGEVEAVSVLQRPTDLALDTVTVRINQVFIATATLTDLYAEDAGIADKTIDFLFAGTPKSALTSGVGLASVTYTAPASSGPFSLQATYDEEVIYAASSSVILVQVLGDAAELSAPAESREINKVFTASATLTSGGSPVDAHTLRFVFNGATHTATTDALGLATSDYAMPAASGTYILEIYFDGTPVLDVSYSTAEIAAQPIPAVLSGESDTVNALEDFKATATLTGTYGLVQGETVRFVLNGATQYAETNSAGAATATYKAPAASGTHMLEFYYDGSPEYDVYVTTEELTVLQQATTLDVKADTVAVNTLLIATATLSHSTGVLAGMPIEITFEGETHTVYTNALGEATTGFTAPLTSGTYNISAQYNETATYVASSSDTDVDIMQRVPYLAITPATAMVDGVFTASATLTDFAGGVAGKTIRFVFNGASHTAVTDGLGLATTDYAVPETSGTYRIEAYFDEDAGYEFAGTTDALTALPIPAVLSGPSISIGLSEIFTATATLTSSTGPLTGHAIRFLFAVAIQTDTTDGLGEATTTFFSPSSSGTYQVNFEYDGTPRFAAITSTAEVIVLPDATSLTAPATAALALESFIASATLTSGANPLAGETLRFSMEGTTLTAVAVTDAVGVGATIFPAPASSGTYKLVIEYDGSGIYGVAASTAEVVISSRITSVFTSSDTTLTLDIFTAAAALSDKAGAVAGQTIRFVFAGATQTAVTDALGVATTDYAAPAASGTYQLDVFMDATSTYDLSYASETIKVDGRFTDVVPSSAATLVSAVFTASATLTDPLGAVVGKTVSFHFNGSTQTGITDALGLATTDFASPVSSGTYLLEVTFSTSPTYIGASSWTYVDAAPRPTGLAAEAVLININEVYTATATLTHSTGTLAGHTVRFVVDGTSQTAVTDALGVAATDYTAPDSTGTLVLEIYFDETPHYGFSQATETIVVVGRPTEVSGPAAAVEVGRIFTASATLVDVSTGPLEGHTVRFVFNGATHTAVTDVLGEATTDYASPASSGTYTLDIRFDGTQYHAPSVSTAEVTVAPIPTSLAFEVPVTSAMAVFTASSTLSQYGTPIAGETVRFVLVSTTHTDTTDGLGRATTDYTAPAASGTYPIGAYFDGTSALAESSATLTLTVLQRESYIAVEAVAATASVVFKATATLSDMDGPVAGKTLSFFHRGSTETAVTDILGVATVSFTASASSGTFPLSLTLDEDAAYVLTTASAAVTVAPRPTSIAVDSATVAALDLFIATATLTDIDGAVAGETMQFVLNGITQTGVTDALGVATTGFYAPVSSGTYAIDVTIAETPAYAAAAASAAAVVVQRAIQIRGTNITVEELTPFIAVGNLFDKATGAPLVNKDIEFFFEPAGSSTDTQPTNSLGRATATYSSPGTVGSYFYNVTFLGDATYETGNSTAIVFVGEATNLLAQDVDAVVNSSVTVMATLRDGFAQAVVGEQITFTFQGSSITSVTDAEGIARATFTTPGTGGDFAYLAEFAGNGTLSPASDEATVHVSLNISLLAAFDATAIQNRAFQAKAKLIDVSDGDGIAGKSIDFLFGGTPLSGVTGSDGVAAVTFSAPNSTGTYTFTADFAGDATYSGSDSTGTITVLEASGEAGANPTKINALKITARAETVFAARATLIDLNVNAGLSGKPLLFIFGSSSTLTTTNSAGVAQATFTAPSSSGALVYTVQFAGDGQFSSSQATQTVAVGLLAPRDPAGLQAAVLSATQMRLTWQPVTAAESGEDMTALVAEYWVEKAVDPAGSWTSTAVVSTTSALAFTADIEAAAVYYRVRTLSTQGESSRGLAIAEVSAAPQAVFMAPDNEAWVALPEGARALIASKYGAGAGVQVSSEAPGGFLSIYNYQLVRDGETLIDAAAGEGRYGAQIVLSYAGLGSGAAMQADQRQVVYWHNGVEWVKLGGQNDALRSRISVRSNRLGRFALGYGTLASDFSLTKVAPRIFTPGAADITINRAVFYFENPADNDVTIRIFDITGAVVRRNLLRDGSNMIYWDGKDSGGTEVKGGVYIYQIEGDDEVHTGTVVVAK